MLRPRASQTARMPQGAGAGDRTAAARRAPAIFILSPMFEQLSDKLEGIFKRLRGQAKLTEENVAETLREVRVVLLAADVNFKTAKDFINAVKEKAVGADVLTSLTPGQVMVKILHDELVALLGGESEEPEVAEQGVGRDRVRKHMHPRTLRGIRRQTVILLRFARARPRATGRAFHRP